MKTIFVLLLSFLNGLLLLVYIGSATKDFESMYDRHRAGAWI